MHCSDWPRLVDVGLGLARFFWPRPHDTLASLTSLVYRPMYVTATIVARVDEALRAFI